MFELGWECCAAGKPQWSGFVLQPDKGPKHPGEELLPDDQSEE